MKTKFIYTEKPRVSHVDWLSNETVVQEFENTAQAHADYAHKLKLNYRSVHKSDGKGYYIIDPSFLVEEAELLISQLQDRLATYYIEHPRLGFVPRDGSGLIRRRLKDLINLAKRRKIRRMQKAGMHIRICGLDGLINSLDSSWF